MEQSTFLTINPDEHVSLIQQTRDRRNHLRKLIAEHFAKRQAIAGKLNEALAQRDDAIDGKVQHTTAAELVALIRAAHAKHERIEADMEAALERQRELKAMLDQACADLEAAIGGIQRTVIEAIATVEPAKHATSKDLRTARQSAVADACVKALAAMGGRASCVDLASLVGVSSHGLGGLIDGDPRIVKKHEGRLQNVATVYELAD